MILQLYYNDTMLPCSAPHSLSTLQTYISDIFLNDLKSSFGLFFINSDEKEVEVLTQEDYEKLTKDVGAVTVIIKPNHIEVGQTNPQIGSSKLTKKDLEEKRYYQLSIERIIEKLEQNNIYLEKIDFLAADDQTIEAIKKTVFKAVDDFYISILEQSRIYAKIRRILLEDGTLVEEKKVDLIEDQDSDASVYSEEESLEDEEDDPAIQEIRRVIEAYKARIDMIDTALQNKDPTGFPSFLDSFGTFLRSDLKCDKIFKWYVLEELLKESSLGIDLRKEEYSDIWKFLYESLLNLATPYRFNIKETTPAEVGNLDTKLAEYTVGRTFTFYFKYFLDAIKNDRWSEACTAARYIIEVIISINLLIC